MRLGLTLPLLPMETLPSFVSYIAQRNGLRHVQDFVQDMDLSCLRHLLQAVSHRLVMGSSASVAVTCRCPFWISRP